MKPVNLKAVRERIAHIENLNARGVGTAVESQQFELACLRKLEELYAERDALAAEGAAIKSKVAIHAAGFSVCQACGHEEPSETDDIVCIVNGTPTPATDAYLNSVRADAIDEFGNLYNFRGRLYVQREAKRYANHIRAGRGGE